MRDRDDIDIKPLLQWFTGLTVLLIGSLVVCAVFVAGFGWVNRRFLDKPKPPLAPARRLPPEPRLQPNPPVELQKLRESEERILHHYAWIDRPRGIVRIPIDRAIDLLAQEAGRSQ